MPKIIKLNNVNTHCFSQQQIDRLSNIPLGKYHRVYTNNILKKDPRLNQFFNEKTMGALDNYAQHENITIHIKPLRNDMFNDVAVYIFQGMEAKAKFPMNIAQTKEEIPAFFRDLYNKIHNATHTPEEPKIVPKTKHSKWENFKMYAQNVADRYNDFRFSFLKND